MIYISSSLVQSHHAHLLANLAVRKSSLDLSNGSAEHVLAVLGNDMGTFLGSIEFNQLMVLIYNEGDEMMLDIALAFSFSALSLSCKSFMLVFELIAVLKRGGSLCWRLCCHLLLEFLQDTAIDKRDLVCIVQACVKASDDSTRVVKSSSLLHVERDNTIVFLGALLNIFLSLQSFNCDNYSNDWLLEESKQLFIKPEHFSDSPVLGHSDPVHVLGKYFRVALEWWPVEVGLLLFCHLLFG